MQSFGELDIARIKDVFNTEHGFVNNAFVSNVRKRLFELCIRLDVVFGRIVSEFFPGIEPERTDQLSAENIVTGVRCHMGVIRCNERKLKQLCNLYEFRHGICFNIKPVELELNIEVAFAEDGDVLFCCCDGFIEQIFFIAKILLLSIDLFLNGVPF